MHDRMLLCLYLREHVDERECILSIVVYLFTVAVLCCVINGVDMFVDSCSLLINST